MMMILIRTLRGEASVCDCVVGARSGVVGVCCATPCCSVVAVVVVLLVLA